MDNGPAISIAYDVLVFINLIMGPIISRSHYTFKYEGIIMMDQDIWNPFLG